MRKDDAKKLYSALEPHIELLQEYGLSQEIQVSNKELIQGGIKPLDHKKLKAWFLSLAILGHYIEQVCFQNRNNLCLNSDNIRTLGNGIVSRKQLPEVVKVKLSKADKEKLYQLHEKIKKASNEAREAIHTYEGSTHITCSYYNIMAIGTHSLEISVFAEDICENRFKI